VDYTIVMPVFNKAALTKQCLETIRPTLRGAGEGEIIVIDNASSDETPAMLEEYPWVTVVRNDVNLGFSGANNQGARMARGEYLVLLNNDTVAKPGWLAAMLARAREPGVGIVGAKLLFPSGTIQHAGVVTQPFRFGSAGFGAFHDLYNVAGNHPAVNVRADFRTVTGACLVTPRALYAELGGLDEGFWNGYEDVDYCFKVAERGLRIVYEPAAVLTHFESQSGPQRFRKVSYNIDRLNGRWNDKAVFDANIHRIARGTVRREVRYSQRTHTFESIVVPATTILLHGPLDLPQPAALAENRAPVARILRAADEDAVAAIRTEMEVRGDRYLAIVDARAMLQPGWLDELIRQVEFSWNVAAATYAPELATGEDVNPLAADARATLLSLRQFPQHLRVGAFPTANGAVADLLLRALAVRVATRGAGFARAVVPPAPPDPAFEERWGMPLAGIHTTDAARIEPFLIPPPVGAPPLVSILMLSWNAPEYTKLALESIRAHTRAPYEVVIVDNGSGPETTDWLRTLEDVRVVYNATNRGFAGGSNQAIAAARGEYVVLLNNDTVVTEGWLDGLLDAFRRVPALGVSAVRSNRVAGVQMVPDVPYRDIDGMHAYAAERRRAYRRQGFVIDRAIGLCLCVPRAVIDEVGGIDERFGVGNFEDDDFCLRVRAAGYRIYVCDDVFIHHFGSKTFAANKIDYRATMSENWEKFAAKWSLKKLEGVDGYDARPAYRGGFVRERHFVALPSAPDEASAAPADEAARGYETIFAGIVHREADWQEIGAFVRRYLQAFSAQDATLCAIAASGDLDANALGERIRRACEKLGVSDAAAADVIVSDETDLADWLAGLPSGAPLAIGDAPELAGYAHPSQQSPSALRRAYASGDAR
jgi:GT2 family glycosyltransferase